VRHPEEGIAKLDKSPPQIQNPKFQNWTRTGVETSVRMARQARQFNSRFWDFGFEVGFCPISQFFAALDESGKLGPSQVRGM
jgi:hypothetical protein